MKRAWRDFDVREKAPAIAVIIVLWLGANLAFAFLVNVPRAAAAAGLEEQTLQVEAQTASRTSEVERLRQHHRRVLEGSDNLNQFYSEVLSTKSERFISFQREVRDIAGKYNINVDAISYPREAFPKDKVTKLSAVMPLAGSYESLREFIHTIEKSPSFIVIESIQLANSTEGGVILGLNITLSTYFVDPDLQEETPQRARRASR